MKVYVILREDDLILGIYKDESKAHQDADAYFKNTIECTVEEHEVIE